MTAFCAVLGTLILSGQLAFAWMFPHYGWWRIQLRNSSNIEMSLTPRTVLARKRSIQTVLDLRGIHSRSDGCVLSINWNPLRSISVLYDVISFFVPTFTLSAPSYF